MDSLRDFCFLVFLGLLLLLLQASALVSLFGVRANLLLVFFLFCAVTRRRFSEYAALLILLFFFSFLFLNVWVSSFLFFIFLCVVLFFLRTWLPGRYFFDFFILIFLGTLGFFFGMPVYQELINHGFNFSELVFPPFQNILFEILLNLFTAFVFVFLGTRRFFARIFS